MSVASIRTLVNQLVSPRTSHTDCRQACTTLKALAFDDDSFSALREADAIPALVQAMRASATSPVTQLAADAVWSLSVDEENHAILRGAGVVPLLSVILASGANELIHSAAATLSNLVDLETGMPHEMAADLLATGGIGALVNLLPEDDDAANPTEAQLAVLATLAAVSVHSEIGDEVAQSPRGVEKLVALLHCGARVAAARHAAAIIARIAHGKAATQAAVREADGIAALVDLLTDSLETSAVTGADEQAAQHAAGALWILADDAQCRTLIHAQPGVLTALAVVVTGKLGTKAEGNAAGALLALGLGTERAAPEGRALVPAVDPDSVLNAMFLELRPQRAARRLASAPLHEALVVAAAAAA